jgi:hypothetical protein
LSVPCCGMLRKALGSMLPYAAVTARSGCRAAKACRKDACVCKQGNTDTQPYVARCIPLL